ncbi:MAG: peptidoglycan endopeptidase [Treponema sp.]|nr:peptidoglycan endopeptidase [Treponema sp.]
MFQRRVFRRVFIFFLFFLLIIPVIPDEGNNPHLAGFSDPARIWGNGVERVIEEAYRLFFQTRIIGGRVMNLRMPFAQNHERDFLTEVEWSFVESGKGYPDYLWDRINELLDSEDFAEYVRALTDGREKVIIFDLPSQSWTISRSLFDIARMRTGSYQGLPHRPWVLTGGGGLEESDVYNYIYAIGLIGIDCSAFVWHVQSYIAAAGGVNLGRVFSGALGVRGGQSPAMFAGTNFFNSNNSNIIAVRDEIRNLRPADIILFRAEDGGMSHSAVIQSINFTTGVIRYVQCTDEAPLAERGVHESFIHFDPRNTRVSLSHPSLVWSQRRYPPFPGELASPFSDDGERYRAFPERGGGRVVRLRPVAEVIDRMARR